MQDSPQKNSQANAKKCGSEVFWGYSRHLVQKSILVELEIR